MWQVECYGSWDRHRVTVEEHLSAEHCARVSSGLASSAACSSLAEHCSVECAASFLTAIARCSDHTESFAPALVAACTGVAEAVLETKIRDNKQGLAMYTSRRVAVDVLPETKTREYQRGVRHV